MANWGYSVGAFCKSVLNLEQQNVEQQNIERIMIVIHNHSFNILQFYIQYSTLNKKPVPVTAMIVTRTG